MDSYGSVDVPSSAVEATFDSEGQVLTAASASTAAVCREPGGDESGRFLVDPLEWNIFAISFSCTITTITIAGPRGTRNTLVETLSIFSRRDFSRCCCCY